MRFISNALVIVLTGVASLAYGMLERKLERTEVIDKPGIYRAPQQTEVLPLKESLSEKEAIEKALANLRCTNDQEKNTLKTSWSLFKNQATRSLNDMFGLSASPKAKMCFTLAYALSPETSGKLGAKVEGYWKSLNTMQGTLALIKIDDLLSKHLPKEETVKTLIDQKDYAFPELKKRFFNELGEKKYAKEATQRNVLAILAPHFEEEWAKELWNVLYAAFFDESQKAWDEENPEEKLFQKDEWGTKRGQKTLPRTLWEELSAPKKMGIIEKLMNKMVYNKFLIAKLREQIKKSDNIIPLLEELVKEFAQVDNEDEEQKEIAIKKSDPLYDFLLNIFKEEKNIPQKLIIFLQNKENYDKIWQNVELMKSEMPEEDEEDKEELKKRAHFIVDFRNSLKYARPNDFVAIFSEYLKKLKNSDDMDLEELIDQKAHEQERTALAFRQMMSDVPNEMRNSADFLEYTLFRKPNDILPENLWKVIAFYKEEILDAVNVFRNKKCANPQETLNKRINEEIEKQVLTNKNLKNYLVNTITGLKCSNSFKTNTVDNYIDALVSSCALRFKNKRGGKGAEDNPCSITRSDITKIVNILAGIGQQKNFSSFLKAVSEKFFQGKEIDKAEGEDRLLRRILVLFLDSKVIENEKKEKTGFRDAVKAAIETIDFGPLDEFRQLDEVKQQQLEVDLGFLNALKMNYFDKEKKVDYSKKVGILNKTLESELKNDDNQGQGLGRTVTRALKKIRKEEKEEGSVASVASDVGESDIATASVRSGIEPRTLLRKVWRKNPELVSLILSAPRTYKSSLAAYAFMAAIDFDRQWYDAVGEGKDLMGEVKANLFPNATYKEAQGALIDILYDTIITKNLVYKDRKIWLKAVTSKNIIPQKIWAHLLTNGKKLMMTIQNILGKEPAIVHLIRQTTKQLSDAYSGILWRSNDDTYVTSLENFLKANYGRISKKALDAHMKIGGSFLQKSGDKDVVKNTFQDDSSRLQMVSFWRGSEWLLSSAAMYARLKKMDNPGDAFMWHFLSRVFLEPVIKIDPTELYLVNGYLRESAYPKMSLLPVFIFEDAFSPRREALRTALAGMSNEKIKKLEDTLKTAFKDYDINTLRTKTAQKTFFNTIRIFTENLAISSAKPDQKDGYLGLIQDDDIFKALGYIKDRKNPDIEKNKIDFAKYFLKKKNEEGVGKECYAVVRNLLEKSDQTTKTNFLNFFTLSKLEQSETFAKQCTSEEDLFPIFAAMSLKNKTPKVLTVDGKKSLNDVALDLYKGIFEKANFLSRDGIRDVFKEFISVYSQEYDSKDMLGSINKWHTWVRNFFGMLDDASTQGILIFVNEFFRLMKESGNLSDEYEKFFADKKNFLSFMKGLGAEKGKKFFAYLTKKLADAEEKENLSVTMEFMGFHQITTKRSLSKKYIDYLKKKEDKWGDNFGWVLEAQCADFENPGIAEKFRNAFKDILETPRFQMIMRIMKNHYAIKYSPDKEYAKNKYVTTTFFDEMLKPKEVEALKEVSNGFSQFNDDPVLKKEDAIKKNLGPPQDGSYVGTEIHQEMLSDYRDSGIILEKEVENEELFKLLTGKEKSLNQQEENNPASWLSSKHAIALAMVYCGNDEEKNEGTYQEIKDSIKGFVEGVEKLPSLNRSDIIEKTMEAVIAYSQSNKEKQNLKKAFDLRQFKSKEDEKTKFFNIMSKLPKVNEEIEQWAKNVDSFLQAPNLGYISESMKKAYTTYREKNGRIAEYNRGVRENNNRYKLSDLKDFFPGIENTTYMNISWEKYAAMLYQRCYTLEFTDQQIGVIRQALEDPDSIGVMQKILYLMYRLSEKNKTIKETGDDITYKEGIKPYKDLEKVLFNSQQNLISDEKITESVKEIEDDIMWENVTNNLKNLKEKADLKNDQKADFKNDLTTSLMQKTYGTVKITMNNDSLYKEIMKLFNVKKDIEVYSRKADTFVASLIKDTEGLKKKKEIESSIKNKEHVMRLLDFFDAFSKENEKGESQFWQDIDTSKLENLMAILSMIPKTAMQTIAFNVKNDPDFKTDYTEYSNEIFKKRDVVELGKKETDKDAFGTVFYKNTLKITSPIFHKIFGNALYAYYSSQKEWKSDYEKFYTFLSFKLAREIPYQEKQENFQWVSGRIQQYTPKNIIAEGKKENFDEAIRLFNTVIPVTPTKKEIVEEDFYDDPMDFLQYLVTTLDIPWEKSEIVAGVFKNDREKYIKKGAFEKLKRIIIAIRVLFIKEIQEDEFSITVPFTSPMSVFFFQVEQALEATIVKNLKQNPNVISEEIDIFSSKMDAYTFDLLFTALAKTFVLEKDEPIFKFPYEGAKETTFNLPERHKFIKEIPSDVAYQVIAKQGENGQMFLGKCDPLEKSPPISQIIKNGNIGEEKENLNIIQAAMEEHKAIKAQINWETVGKDWKAYIKKTGGGNLSKAIDFIKLNLSEKGYFLEKDIRNSTFFQTFSKKGSEKTDLTDDVLLKVASQLLPDVWEKDEKDNLDVQFAQMIQESQKKKCLENLLPILAKLYIDIPKEEPLVKGYIKIKPKPDLTLDFWRELLNEINKNEDFRAIAASFSENRKKFIEEKLSQDEEFFQLNLINRLSYWVDKSHVIQENVQNIEHLKDFDGNFIKALLEGKPIKEEQMLGQDQQQQQQQQLQQQQDGEQDGAKEDILSKETDWGYYVFALMQLKEGESDQAFKQLHQNVIADPNLLNAYRTFVVLTTELLLKKKVVKEDDFIKKEGSEVFRMKDKQSPLFPWATSLSLETIQGLLKKHQYLLREGAAYQVVDLLKNQKIEDNDSFLTTLDEKLKEIEQNNRIVRIDEIKKDPVYTALQAKGVPSVRAARLAADLIRSPEEIQGKKGEEENKKANTLQKIINNSQFKPEVINRLSQLLVGVFLNFQGIYNDDASYIEGQESIEGKITRGLKSFFQKKESNELDALVFKKDETIPSDVWTSISEALPQKGLLDALEKADDSMIMEVIESFDDKKSASIQEITKRLRIWVLKKKLEQSKVKVDEKSMILMDMIASYSEDQSLDNVVANPKALDKLNKLFAPLLKKGSKEIRSIVMEGGTNHLTPFLLAERLQSIANLSDSEIDTILKKSGSANLKMLDGYVQDRIRHKKGEYTYVELKEIAEAIGIAKEKAVVYPAFFQYIKNWEDQGESLRKLFASAWINLIETGGGLLDIVLYIIQASHPQDKSAPSSKINNQNKTLGKEDTDYAPTFSPLKNYTLERFKTLTAPNEVQTLLLLKEVPLKQFTEETLRSIYSKSPMLSEIAQKLIAKLRESNQYVVDVEKENLRSQAVNKNILDLTEILPVWADASRQEKQGQFLTFIKQHENDVAHVKNFLTLVQKRFLSKAVTKGGITVIANDEKVPLSLWDEIGNEEIVKEMFDGFDVGLIGVQEEEVKNFGKDIPLDTESYLANALEALQLQKGKYRERVLRKVAGGILPKLFTIEKEAWKKAGLLEDVWKPFATAILSGDKGQYNGTLAKIIRESAIHRVEEEKYMIYVLTRTFLLSQNAVATEKGFFSAAQVPPQFTKEFLGSCFSKDNVKIFSDVELYSKEMEPLIQTLASQNYANAQAFLTKLREALRSIMVSRGYLSKEIIESALEEKGDLATQDPKLRDPFVMSALQQKGVKLSDVKAIFDKQPKDGITAFLKLMNTFFTPLEALPNATKATKAMNAMNLDRSLGKKGKKDKVAVQKVAEEKEEVLVQASNAARKSLVIPKNLWEIFLDKKKMTELLLMLSYLQTETIDSIPRGLTLYKEPKQFYTKLLHYAHFSYLQEGREKSEHKEVTSYLSQAFISDPANITKEGIEQSLALRNHASYNLVLAPALKSVVNGLGQAIPLEKALRENKSEVEKMASWDQGVQQAFIERTEDIPSFIERLKTTNRQWEGLYSAEDKTALQGAIITDPATQRILIAARNGDLFSPKGGLYNGIKKFVETNQKVPNVGLILKMIDHHYKLSEKITLHQEGGEKINPSKTLLIPIEEWQDLLASMTKMDLKMDLSDIQDIDPKLFANVNNLPKLNKVTIPEIVQRLISYAFDYGKVPVSYVKKYPLFKLQEKDPAFLKINFALQKIARSFQESQELNTVLNNMKKVQNPRFWEIFEDTYLSDITEQDGFMNAPRKKEGMLVFLKKKWQGTWGPFEEFKKPIGEFGATEIQSFSEEQFEKLKVIMQREKPKSFASMLKKRADLVKAGRSYTFSGEQLDEVWDGRVKNLFGESGSEISRVFTAAVLFETLQNTKDPLYKMLSQKKLYKEKPQAMKEVITLFYDIFLKEKISKENNKYDVEEDVEEEFRQGNLLPSGGNIPDTTLKDMLVSMGQILTAKEMYYKAFVESIKKAAQGANDITAFNKIFSEQTANVLAKTGLIDKTAVQKSEFYKEALANNGKGEAVNLRLGHEVMQKTKPKDQEQGAIVLPLGLTELYKSEAANAIDYMMGVFLYPDQQQQEQQQAQGKEDLAVKNSQTLPQTLWDDVTPKDKAGPMQAFVKALAKLSSKELQKFIQSEKGKGAGDYSLKAIVTRCFEVLLEKGGEFQKSFAPEFAEQLITSPSTFNFEDINKAQKLTPNREKWLTAFKEKVLTGDKESLSYKNISDVMGKEQLLNDIEADKNGPIALFIDKALYMKGKGTLIGDGFANALERLFKRVKGYKEDIFDPEEMDEVLGKANENENAQALRKAILPFAGEAFKKDGLVEAKEHTQKVIALEKALNDNKIPNKEAAELLLRVAQGDKAKRIEDKEFWEINSWKSLLQDIAALQRADLNDNDITELQESTGNAQSFLTAVRKPLYERLLSKGIFFPGLSGIEKISEKSLDVQKALAAIAYQRVASKNDKAYENLYSVLLEGYQSGTRIAHILAVTVLKGLAAENNKNRIDGLNKVQFPLEETLKSTSTFWEMIDRSSQLEFEALETRALETYASGKLNLLQLEKDFTMLQGNLKKGNDDDPTERFHAWQSINKVVPEKEQVKFENLNLTQPIMNFIDAYFLQRRIIFRENNNVSILRAREALVKPEVLLALTKNNLDLWLSPFNPQQMSDLATILREKDKAQSDLGKSKIKSKQNLFKSLLNMNKSQIQVPEPKPSPEAFIQSIKDSALSLILQKGIANDALILQENASLTPYTQDVPFLRAAMVFERSSKQFSELRNELSKGLEGITKDQRPNVVVFLTGLMNLTDKKDHEALYAFMGNAAKLKTLASFLVANPKDMVTLAQAVQKDASAVSLEQRIYRNVVLALFPDISPGLAKILVMHIDHLSSFDDVLINEEYTKMIGIYKTRGNKKKLITVLADGYLSDIYPQEQAIAPVLKASTALLEPRYGFITGTLNYSQGLKEIENAQETLLPTLKQKFLEVVPVKDLAVKNWQADKFQLEQKLKDVSSDIKGVYYDTDLQKGIPPNRIAEISQDLDGRKFMAFLHHAELNSERKDLKTKFFKAIGGNENPNIMPFIKAFNKAIEIDSYCIVEQSACMVNQKIFPKIKNPFWDALFDEKKLPKAAEIAATHPWNAQPITWNNEYILDNLVIALSSNGFSDYSYFLPWADPKKSTNSVMRAILSAVRMKPDFRKRMYALKPQEKKGLEQLIDILGSQKLEQQSLDAALGYVLEDNEKNYIKSLKINDEKRAAYINGFSKVPLSRVYTLVELTKLYPNIAACLGSDDVFAAWAISLVRDRCGEVQGNVLGALLEQMSQTYPKAMKVFFEKAKEQVGKVISTEKGYKLETANYPVIRQKSIEEWTKGLQMYGAFAENLVDKIDMKSISYTTLDEMTKAIRRAGKTSGNYRTSDYEKTAKTLFGKDPIKKEEWLFTIAFSNAKLEAFDTYGKQLSRLATFLMKHNFIQGQLIDTDVVKTTSTLPPDIIKTFQNPQKREALLTLFYTLTGENNGDEAGILTSYKEPNDFLKSVIYRSLVQRIVDEKKLPPILDEKKLPPILEEFANVLAGQNDGGLAFIKGLTLKDDLKKGYNELFLSISEHKEEKGTIQKWIGTKGWPAIADALGKVAPFTLMKGHAEPDTILKKIRSIEQKKDGKFVKSELVLPAQNQQNFNQYHQEIHKREKDYLIAFIALLYKSWYDEKAKSLVRVHITTPEAVTEMHKIIKGERDLRRLTLFLRTVFPDLSQFVTVESDQLTVKNIPGQLQNREEFMNNFLVQYKALENIDYAPLCMDNKNQVMLPQACKQAITGGANIGVGQISEQILEYSKKHNVIPLPLDKVNQNLEKYKILIEKSEDAKKQEGKPNIIETIEKDQINPKGKKNFEHMLDKLYSHNVVIIGKEDDKNKMVKVSNKLTQSELESLDKIDVPKVLPKLNQLNQKDIDEMLSQEKAGGNVPTNDEKRKEILERLEKRVADQIDLKKGVFTDSLLKDFVGKEFVTKIGEKIAWRAFAAAVYEKEKDQVKELSQEQGKPKLQTMGDMLCSWPNLYSPETLSRFFELINTYILKDRYSEQDNSITKTKDKEPLISEDEWKQFTQQNVTQALRAIDSYKDEGNKLITFLEEQQPKPTSATIVSVLAKALEKQALITGTRSIDDIHKSNIWTSALKNKGMVEEINDLLDSDDRASYYRELFIAEVLKKQDKEQEKGLDSAIAGTLQAAQQQEIQGKDVSYYGLREILRILVEWKLQANQVSGDKKSITTPNVEAFSLSLWGMLKNEGKENKLAVASKKMRELLIADGWQGQYAGTLKPDRRKKIIQILSAVNDESKFLELVTGSLRRMQQLEKKTFKKDDLAKVLGIDIAKDPFSEGLAPFSVWIITKYKEDYIRGEDLSQTPEAKELKAALDQYKQEPIDFIGRVITHILDEYRDNPQDTITLKKDYVVFFEEVAKGYDSAIAHISQGFLIDVYPWVIGESKEAFKKLNLEDPDTIPFDDLKKFYREERQKKNYFKASDWSDWAQWQNLGLDDQEKETLATHILWKELSDRKDYKGFLQLELVPFLKAFVLAHQNKRSEKDGYIVIEKDVTQDITPEEWEQLQNPGILGTLKSVTQEATEEGVDLSTIPYKIAEKPSGWAGKVKEALWKKQRRYTKKELEPVLLKALGMGQEEKADQDQSPYRWSDYEYRMAIVLKEEKDAGKNELMTKVQKADVGDNLYTKRLILNLLGVFWKLDDDKAHPDESISIKADFKLGEQQQKEASELVAYIQSHTNMLAWRWNESVEAMAQTALAKEQGQTVQKYLEEISIKYKRSSEHFGILRLSGIFQEDEKKEPVEPSVKKVRGALDTLFNTTPELAEKWKPYMNNNGFSVLAMALEKAFLKDYVVAGDQLLKSFENLPEGVSNAFKLQTDAEKTLLASVLESLEQVYGQKEVASNILAARLRREHLARILDKKPFWTFMQEQALLLQAVLLQKIVNTHGQYTGPKANTEGLENSDMYLEHDAQSDQWIVRIERRGDEM